MSEHSINGKGNGLDSSEPSTANNVDSFLLNEKKKGPGGIRRVFSWIGNLCAAFFDLLCFMFMRTGLFAQGGMPHLYLECSHTVLMYRASIGWVLLTGMMLDCAIMFFGWKPILGPSYAWGVALFWVFVMITVDRYILRSMDGNRKPAWALVILRVMVIFTMVVINSALVLVVFLGDSIDKYTAEKNNAKIESINNELADADAEFARWNTGRNKELAEMTSRISAKRDQCIAEATGAGGSKKRGIGPIAEKCDEHVKADQKNLDDMRATYEEERRQNINALNTKKAQINSKFQSAAQEQSMGEGFFGRIHLAFVVSSIMAKEQPWILIAFVLVDLIIVLIQLFPFGSKMAHDLDEYDVAYGRSMWGRVDQLKKQAQEDAHQAQMAEVAASQERELTALEMEVSFLEKKSELERRKTMILTAGDENIAVVQEEEAADVNVAAPLKVN